MKRSIILALAVAAQPLRAQLPTPPNWRWTLDTTARHVNLTDVVPAGSFGFVSMAPGWHVTMGPGGVLYEPRYMAEGRYTVESRMVLFPGTGSAEYGVFVGGEDLDGLAGKWVAFVVRRDGSAAVLRHEKGRTESVLPWAKHAGVKPHPGGDETVGNTIRITVDTAVVFQVNDMTVATLSRTGLTTDGRFGFRIGPGLNMHVTSLDVTHRLAPAPNVRVTGLR